MAISNQRALAATLALAASISLSGCGGGGGSSPSAVIPGSQAPAGASKTNATATIVIPPRAPASSTSSHSRRPQWISPLTAGVDIFSTVNGQAVTDTLTALTPSSPNCHPGVPSGTVCTVSFAVVPGQQNITVNLYDAPNTLQGNILATTTQPFNLIGGVNNPNINFVLNAVPASIYPTSVGLNFTAGTPFTYSNVAMSEQDADGEDISSVPWDAPIATTLDDTTHGLSVNLPFLAGGSPTNLTFNYSGNPNTATTVVNWCSTIFWVTPSIPAPCWASEILVNTVSQSVYVSNTTGNVLGFMPFSPGSTSPAPIRTIPAATKNFAGALVGGGGAPAGIAVDNGGTTFFAEPSTNAVVRAPQGVGNTSPFTLSVTMGALTGPLTTLNGPTALALDNANRLWVSNTGANSLLKFQCCGNRAPLVTVTSAAMTAPRGIAIDQSNNNIYVVNGTGTQILEFASSASGASTPVGSTGGLTNATGIAVHGTTVYVADAGTNSVYEFATGTLMGPSTTISGAATGLSGPAGIAVDSSGNIYVANNTSNTVTKYSSGASGNVAPVSTVSGAATTINGAAGVAIRP